MKNQDILMIFLKPFIEGKVKTRLGKSIGEKKALEVYKKLVSHTIKEVEKLTARVKVYFFYSEEAPTSNQIPAKHQFLIQNGKTLGDRMAAAFDWAAKEGYNKKIIIGSDCAELSVEHLNQAFSDLEGNELVIGPAKDGGYYLIGMKNCHPEIFADIQWSTNSVYNTTIDKIESSALQYATLKVLSDIDDLEDLKGAPSYLDSFR